MSTTPMNTCGESSWRTRRIVTPSAASSTSSTAAFAAVSRALPAIPASARRSARLCPRGTPIRARPSTLRRERYENNVMAA